jgi:hypothetical protein
MTVRCWIGSGLIALVAVVALSCADDGVTTPEPEDEVQPLLIMGDMAAQSQDLTITRQGRPVLNAAVSVNGIAIPHTGGGRYQGQLPAAVPAGSPLVVQVSASETSVEGAGFVPEAPVLTAPATGTVFEPTDSITVAWTSATDPDRFLVFVFDPGELGPEVFTASGTARQMEIVAGDFSPDTEVTIAIFAQNDGSFTGSAHTDSQMNIRAESPAEVVFTRNAARVRVQGVMSALVQDIFITRGERAVTDALVTVNGVAIPPRSAGQYRGVLTEALSPGSLIHLEVSADGATVEAAGEVPEPPVFTAPAEGSVFASTDSIRFAWTSATDPDRFDVFASDCAIPPCSPLIPGGAREVKIAASDIQPGRDIRMVIVASNDGSFTGSADPDSRMIIQADGPGRPVITILQ